MFHCIPLCGDNPLCHRAGRSHLYMSVFFFLPTITDNVLTRKSRGWVWVHTFSPSTWRQRRWVSVSVSIVKVWEARKGEDPCPVTVLWLVIFLLALGEEEELQL